MVLQNTMNLIYEKCAERVKKAIEEFGLSLSKIYSDDPKILSAVQNNRRTEKNRFLVPDRILNNPNKNDGLVKVLKFNSSQEVLWGTLEEITEYEKELFMCIISDLIANQSELDFSIEEILCDYVPYAKNKTYWNLLFSSENTFPAVYYCISEDTVIENIEADRQNALNYLYRKCAAQFFTALYEFTAKIDSFTKIDKVLEKDFVCKSFIPMLKKHIPNENSLGIRVKNIILADLSHAPRLINSSEDEAKASYYRKLINVSSDYIIKLECIQVEEFSKG